MVTAIRKASCHETTDLIFSGLFLGNAVLFAGMLSGRAFAAACTRKPAL